MSASRTSLRTTVGTLLTTLVLTGSVVSASPAHAAWGSFTNVHDARAQLCKVRLDDGVFRVRLRLDNRKADHAHRGLLYRDRDGGTTSTKVRADAGAVSGVKAVRWRSGDSLVSAVGEIDGPSAGGGVGIGEIPRC